MLFNSLDFVLFFAAVYGLYLALGHRAQNLLLLVASYFFYGCWDWRFLGLIAISTVVDYVCGLRIHSGQQTSTRRRWLLLSMATNLGILFFFKYYGFFADSAAQLLQNMGMQANLHTLHFILPVGISFYTFQTMSYTIDVYRGQLEPTRHFFDFALFVAFFPQLVAGPIERARRLLPQVVLPRTVTNSQIREGAWLILLGYFKKTVIADNLGVFVDQVFEQPDSAFGFAIPIAVVAFAFQIYGDFAGYTDIARGISKLMGFDIMLNFRMPYFAVNPRDFWSRWHISLSTWLRDYLYIPLGGNRHGSVMTYRNLMLTMLLGGLWHGAAWNFVLWGAYHGLLLCLFRLVESKTRAVIPDGWCPGRVLRAGSFFLLTCGGWFLFRMNSVADGWTLLQNTFSPFAWNGKLALLSIACFAGPLLIYEVLLERADDLQLIKRWPVPVRLACYCLVFGLIVLCGATQSSEFIYFQF